MASWGFLNLHTQVLPTSRTTQARGCATSRPAWASPSTAPHSTITGLAEVGYLVGQKHAATCHWPLRTAVVRRLSVPIPLSDRFLYECP
jgi:hypothetical protein